MTDAQPDVTYHGHVKMDGMVSVMELTPPGPSGAGMSAYDLPHAVKHSPTGFSWGYGGSGPADLARSLLIHALGIDAECATCDGTGTVVYVGHESNAMSVGQAEAEFENDGWPETVSRCMDCDGGVAVVPALYMKFKFDVIAKLDQDSDWELSRGDILNWIEANKDA